MGRGPPEGASCRRSRRTDEAWADRRSRRGWRADATAGALGGVRIRRAVAQACPPGRLVAPARRRRPAPPTSPTVSSSYVHRGAGPRRGRGLTCCRRRSRAADGLEQRPLPVRLGPRAQDRSARVRRPQRRRVTRTLAGAAGRWPPGRRPGRGRRRSPAPFSSSSRLDHVAPTARDRRRRAACRSPRSRRPRGWPGRAGPASACLTSWRTWVRSALAHGRRRGFTGGGHRSLLSGV